MKRASLPIVFSLVLSVIALDQVTKYLADTFIDPMRPVRLLPVLQLVNVKNRGAAFGMFAGLGNTFFIAVSVLAIAFIVYLIIRDTEDRFSLCLILSGATGNLIDRLYYGYVRDFVDVYVSTYHWPAFNVADSALTVGIAILLFTYLRGRKPSAPPE